MECLNLNSLKGCLLALVTALTVSGCSTTSLWSSGSPEIVCKEPTAYIYGGTVRNTRIVFYGLTEVAAGRDDAALGGLLAATAVIDFPFSLVADTLFLPIAVVDTVTKCSKNTIANTTGFMH